MVLKDRLRDYYEGNVTLVFKSTVESVPAKVVVSQTSNAFSLFSIH